MTVEKRANIQKFVLWFTTTLGFLWCAYRLFANTGWILDDEPTHWYFSRSVWENFDNLFNGWARFGRNLIHAPVAIFGFTATRVYTLLLAFLAIFITFKTGKELGIKSLWAIPALVIFQEWFPDLSYSVLTQTPTMLVWILGVYLALKKRFWLAAICFGYISMIRHEGILVTGIWGLWVTFSAGGFLHGLITKTKSDKSHGSRFMRDLAIAGFTILPIFIYNVGAFIFINEIPFAVYFNSKPTDHYGSGSIWHYPALLFAWLGLFSFVLAALACFLLRKKDVPAWSLLFLTYMGYFLVQTLIFWKGLFASGGYYHFIMPMAPFFGLLAARFFDLVSARKHGIWVSIILLFCVVHQGFLLKTHQHYHQDWDAFIVANKPLEITLVAKPLAASESRRHLSAAVAFTKEYLKEHRRNKNQVVANFAMNSAAFEQWATPEYNKLRFTPLDDKPVGTIFIWDVQMSELSEGEQLKNFDQEKWKILKFWQKTYLRPEHLEQNPERKFTAVVLEKIK